MVLASRATVGASVECDAGWYPTGRVPECAVCAPGADCSRVNLTASSADAVVVNVGFFAPFSSPDGSEAAYGGVSWQLAAGAGLAAEMFNRRDGRVVAEFGELECGHRLQVTYHNTFTLPFETISRYRESFEYLDATVGPSRSVCAMPMAVNSALDEIPQVSYWATSPDLDVKGTYPYFMRTIPSDSATALAASDFLAAQG